ncbi:GMC family oxidoreductase [Siccirubricoccus sp. KC 17139]|uniref:GMC family oxidoreductase n=1 Tax=Siccirubricoccus soli TaxID=2899147 RepID=A0ABT1D176_9PROT|nr:GMC family oxidoreductase [Siccirubricoccus soli]MCP2681793.1 GMC family oxidoreductase [Siccirubricoccus soli]
MSRRLPPTDVVVVGLGWTGSIMSYELCRAGLRVTAIERGPWRDTPTDFPPTTAPDELRYSIRHDLFVRPAQETLTFRNTMNQTALPIRRWGSFLPGNGVGGAGVHWNGQTWRWHPWDFTFHSSSVARYGADFLPQDHMMQDWGITYEELEESFDRFEYLCGISGKAGNLGGQLQPGGNPFEGSRRRDYPTPPMQMTAAPQLFAKAATELGWKPFPQPSANLSQAYTNPYGCKLAPCTYCGFCERFGCGNFSKSSPQTCVLPVLVRHPGFEARTECQVTRVNLSRDGKRATGVTYVDTAGQEWEQPAALVLLCAYQLFNVRLLLLSGIGKPYNPATGEGVVGRNYAYQVTGGATGFFGQDKIFNPFIGAGSVGMVADEFNADNFDHGPAGFVGGASLACILTNGRPITNRPVPPDTPRWGSEWKRATRDNYNRWAAVGLQGSVMPYRGNYLDLDPTYKDSNGLPLLRMTFDFPENERKLSRFAVDRCVEAVRAMGAHTVRRNEISGPYSIVPYQSTHNTGGAIMGSDPKTSVANKYCQVWDVPNVFLSGASLFPMNAGFNPTGPVGALAYWAADAIRDRYLPNPGPLVPA